MICWLLFVVFPRWAAIGASALKRASRYILQFFKRPPPSPLFFIFFFRIGARATSKMSGATLKRLMGFFMMAVAPTVPLKGYLYQSSAPADPTAPRPPLTVSMLAQCACLGVVSGALSGLFGVGGGSIVTPALAMIADLPHQAVLGTTLASMVIPSMIGASAHWRLGNVAARALPGLLVGTVIGAICGAQLAMVVPQEALRWFFAVSFLVLGAKSAFKI